MKDSSDTLVSYCGQYCGACGIRQGRIRKPAEELLNVMKAYGFDKISSELARIEPSFENYSEFEKVIGGILRLFGGCPECMNGGCNPECVVRICCRQKKYTNCSECPEMDSCGKLRGYDRALKELRKIRAVGLEKWLAEMQRKVAAGFCYLDEKER